MFNSLEEIKKFIEWCKANKIKSFKHENMNFELSDMAFIEELNQTRTAESAQEDKEKFNLDEAQQNEEDEQLLLWSSND